MSEDGSSVFPTAAAPPAAVSNEKTTTDAITWVADSSSLASDIQTKLLALTNIGAGNVTVTSSSGVIMHSGDPQTFLITYLNDLTFKAISLLTVDGSNLNGNRSFFVNVGPDGTSLHFDASAAATNLHSLAPLSPF